MSDTQQSSPTDQAGQATSTATVPPPAVAPPPPAPRRLVRTLDDKWLGGVCGGLARYTNVDATLVRVLAVVAGVVFFPVSVLAYLVLWMVMPTV